MDLEVVLIALWAHLREGECNTDKVQGPSGCDAVVCVWVTSAPPSKPRVSRAWVDGSSALRLCNAPKGMKDHQEQWSGGLLKTDEDGAAGFAPHSANAR